MADMADIKKSSILVYIQPELVKEVLYPLLNIQKFQIEIVKTPAECLEKIYSTEFDSLIIDASLLKIEDRVNVPLLHELTTLLPVIIIAGKEDFEIELEIRREKIFYYLVKPVNQKELIEVLERATEWSQGGERR